MEPSKERYKRVRGALLKLMAHSHPRPVDVVVLHSLLDDLGYTVTREELDSHLVYLCDGTKGYCKVTERRGGGVCISMCTITPKGLDLLDQFTPEADPGVDVRF